MDSTTLTKATIMGPKIPKAAPEFCRKSKIKNKTKTIFKNFFYLRQQ